MTRLRAGNLVLAALHSAQAILIVVIGATLTIPITASWAQGPPERHPRRRALLFDLSVRWCVAAFPPHGSARPPARGLAGAVSWYERNLARGINYARWIKYSFSASLMVVLIATFAGTDLRALIAVAGANACMILFGLLMERVNLGRERLDWLPFWFGCVAGAVPWVVIGISPRRLRDRGVSARLRVGDLRLALPLLQQLRGQHVAAVPRNRPWRPATSSGSGATSSSA